MLGVQSWPKRGGKDIDEVSWGWRRVLVTLSTVVTESFWSMKADF